MEHRRAKVAFEEQFYRVRKNKTTSAPLQIYGFPIVNGGWCNSKLKMAAIPGVKESGDVSYIGIAADEPNRFPQPI